MQHVRTLTAREKHQLLKTTLDHREGLRDGVIFTLALHTGLREHELLALNVGDVRNQEGIKQWVQLRVFKRGGHEDVQQVALNTTCRRRLEGFLKAKARAHEDLQDDAPLFVSKRGKRLSTRMLRHAFQTWQKRAGFERSFSFHGLRHTACSDVYKLKLDIKMTQRFARHANVATTSIYTHPSDADLANALELLK